MTVPILAFTLKNFYNTSLNWQSNSVTINLNWQKKLNSSFFDICIAKFLSVKALVHSVSIIQSVAQATKKEENIF